MAGTATVNFRMDADLKKAMENACKEMGMSITAAFTIYATRVARERRIPFEISAHYSVPNKETVSAMREARRISDDPSVKRYGVDDALAELKK